MSSPWPLPIMFTSWGFRTKADKWSTPDELAAYLQAANCPTVAVQLGNEPTTGGPNCTRDEARRLRELGVHVLVWGITGVDYLRQELDRLETPQTDWFPQVENDAERDLVLDQGNAGIHCPAIVTTYGGASTPADVDALHGCGVKAVHVECYAVDDAHKDIDLMMWQGTQYGWPADELYPCFSTYICGEMPDTYRDTAGVERNFSLYLAEPMTSDQFYAWGDWSGGPKPEPPTPEPEEEMDPITDTQALDTHKTASQAALSAYTDPKPKGRNTIIWRIANADDTTWNKARDKVLADLNAAGVPDVPS